MSLWTPKLLHCALLCPYSARLEEDLSTTNRKQNSFMRPRILSGPWAVGLSIYVFISIYISIYLNIFLYLHTYLHLRISITPYLRWIKGLAAPPLLRGAVDMSGGM